MYYFVCENQGQSFSSYDVLTGYHKMWTLTLVSGQAASCKGREGASREDVSVM